MTQTSAPSILGEQSISADATPESQEPEFARLEALLFARTRSHRGLQRELERRDGLLREALERISTSVSSELGALRLGYDAAVARAIEAELARAELTFALDETRAQLTAARPGAGVGSQPSSLGVYGSVAERAAEPSHPRAGDASGVGAVRREQGLRLEEERALREAASAAEQRFQAERVAHAAELAALDARLSALAALQGELNGTRARMHESERAWQAASAQAQNLGQRLGAAQQRIDDARSDAAELTLLAQTRAARIAELTQATNFDQQEIRTLRAQIAAATAAQVAQSEAREADRQLWAERLRQHEQREQEAWNAAAAAVARSEARLREFLGALEQPLRQLDASLDVCAAAPEQEGVATLHASTSEASGTGFELSAVPELQQPLAAEPEAQEHTAAELAGALPSLSPRIADELARERARRTQLAAAVRSLQAATQAGEATAPWIEELVALVGDAAHSGRRRS